MPKIIEDIKQEILAAAKSQALGMGYSKMTMRSVAQQCGIAVGTIYNYYDSKVMLTASFMLEDWYKVLDKMRCVVAFDSTVEDKILGVRMALAEYIKVYNPIFVDDSAGQAFSQVFQTRHVQLRSQLAAVISPLCIEDSSPMLAQFIAESMLSWNADLDNFEEISRIICRLLKNNPIKEK